MKQFVITIHNSKSKKFFPISDRLHFSYGDIFYIFPFAVWLAWYSFSVTMIGQYLLGFTMKAVYMLFIGLLLCKWCFKYQFNVKRIIASCLIMGTVAVESIIADEVFFIVMTFIIASAYDISFRRLTKVSLIVVASVMIITIVSSKLGLIENRVFIESERTRESLGYVYTGLANIMYMNCVNMYIFLRKDKLNIFHWIVIILIMTWLYLYTRTRTDFILVISMFFVWFIFIRNRENNISKNKVLVILFTLVYPFMALFSIVAAIVYDSNNEVWKTLNNVFSSRFELAHKMYVDEGFHLNGNNIVMIGNAAIESGIATKSQYNYIDNGYLQNAFVYGLFVNALIVIGYAILSYRAAKSNDVYLLLWLLFNSIQNIVYPTLVNPVYNLLCIALIMSYSSIFKRKVWDKWKIRGRMRLKE